jgi:hypothetical protein
MQMPAELKQQGTCFIYYVGRHFKNKGGEDRLKMSARENSEKTEI